MTITWNKADLHIHTTHSIDGTARVEEVLEHVATHTDLRVIAITDHDEINGALKARKLAGTYGIEVIVGEEISTAQGHMLALFIEQRVSPGMSVADSIAAVHAQGGLCIAAHPYGWAVPSLGWHGLRKRSRGTDREWSLDGIEVFNASLWLPSNNMTAHSVCKTLGLALCGGSDSHQLSTIGLGYTLFPGTTANDVYRAIQARQTQAGGVQWGVYRTTEYVGLKFKSMVRYITERAARPSLP